MKCSICSSHTTYEKSYGKDSFIVCSCCFEKLVKNTYNKDRITVLDTIINIGIIKEERK